MTWTLASSCSEGQHPPLWHRQKRDPRKGKMACHTPPAPLLRDWTVERGADAVAQRLRQQWFRFPEAHRFQVLARSLRLRVAVPLLRSSRISPSRAQDLQCRSTPEVPNNSCNTITIEASILVPLRLHPQFLSWPLKPNEGIVTCWTKPQPGSVMPQLQKSLPKPIGCTPKSYQSF